MTAKTADGGKLADPEWRRERAIKAARARTSIDAHIAAIEKDADKLTEDQRVRLGRVAIQRVHTKSHVPHIEGQRAMHVTNDGLACCALHSSRPTDAGPCEM